MAGMLRSLWDYRGLTGSLVRRDLRVRSLRALWGSAWLVLQPALMILLYTTIFSQVLVARLPGVDDGLAYALYLCAGLLTWNYFQELVTRSQTLFLEHAHLLKAVRFPRSTLPLALLGSASLNFAIVASVFLVVLAGTGRWPGMALLGFLPLLAVQALLGLGLGVLCGTLNVFYRDVGHAVGVGLTFWFWLTPIVYPLEIVPEALRDVLAWNPLLPLVAGYQGIVVHGAWPAWSEVGVVAALALALGGLAWGVFRALSPDMVDEL